MQKSKSKRDLSVASILDAIGCSQKTSRGHGYIMYLCPFHEDTSPSLQVNITARRGRPEGWSHCYSCGITIRNPADLLHKLTSQPTSSYVNEEELKPFMFLLKSYMEKRGRPIACLSETNGNSQRGYDSNSTFQ